jgi:hypothetical protein
LRVRIAEIASRSPKKARANVLAAKKIQDNQSLSSQQKKHEQEKTTGRNTINR